jgi:hypothetical protein
MSWGTCYLGSNNIHLDFPPIMHDGRNYADWQPGAVINDTLRKEANIKSNWEYRRFLSNNADDIIKFNQLSACGDCCANTAQYGVAKPGNNEKSDKSDKNSPYLYKSCLDNTKKFGYETSDLKNLYLNDYSLQARMVTPVFSQSQLLEQGIARAN